MREKYNNIAAYNKIKMKLADMKPLQAQTSLFGILISTITLHCYTVLLEYHVCFITSNCITQNIILDCCNFMLNKI